MSKSYNQNTNNKNLLQLLYLRLIAIFGQVATILFVHYFLEISLPLKQMTIVIAVLILISCISFFNYKNTKNISDKRLFFELIFDVMAFSAQIYFSGGISNPFISLFLLQVIIATILLSTTYACIIAALTLSCYLWLSKNYQELHAFHHHSQNLFDLHLYGMLISYIIAVILLLIFITKIVKNLKQKDQQILAQEQLIKMGLLAVGTAHELGTPLSTISVILNDLKEISVNEKSKKDFLQDIEIIDLQLQRCKKIISEITSNSGNSRVEEASKIKAKDAFDNLVERWKKLKNPQNLFYKFNYKFQGEENLEIILDDILTQSLFDIFDNAFEASPMWIKIEVEVAKNLIVISVEDKGEGFKKEVLKNLGKPNLSTKNSSGLGLFLAMNSLPRINGKLEIKNTKHGALVKIIIKL